MSAYTTVVNTKRGPEWSFFEEKAGNVKDQPSVWDRKGLNRVGDFVCELWLSGNLSLRKLVDGAATAKRLRVLVVGVDVPSRSDDLKQLFTKLSKSRHEVVFEAAPLLPEHGKFQNINRILVHHDISTFDWLIVTDDDIEIPDRFLDTFLAIAERESLKICMPAHRFRSYLTYLVTQRHWRSLVRQTRFVECGPLTAFHRDVFDFTLPFPELRYAWGTDVWWSQNTWDMKMKIGVVDACPIRHLRPVAGSYSWDAASEEAANFLKASGRCRTKTELLQDVATVSSFKAASISGFALLVKALGDMATRRKN